MTDHTVNLDWHVTTRVRKGLLAVFPNVTSSKNVLSLMKQEKLYQNISKSLSG